MAARNFTGSARIRTAGNKPGTIKNSAELSDMATRMEDIRAGVNSPIKSLRDQNVRVDADVAAVLKRRAYDPLTKLLECLERLVTQFRMGFVMGVFNAYTERRYRYLMRRLRNAQCVQGRPSELVERFEAGK
jgi:hypothetical protein